MNLLVNPSFDSPVSGHFHGLKSLRYHGKQGDQCERGDGHRHGHFNQSEAVGGEGVIALELDSHGW